MRKSYWEQWGHLATLDGIDLYANEGEFVSLVGPSGCGKSTLFNIICGLVPTDEGTVLLDGQDVGGKIGLFGYMPQQDLLLPWRTLLDNVILGPEIRGEDLTQARRQARELLPLFGLEGFERNYPATLSGGMRQRAALLRTFLGRREVLLLDEPFGALDALTRRQMQSWLLQVWHRFRQTILFVTHDVEEAIFLSDRVYVLSERPARVQLELSVPLSRPRQRQQVTGPAFVELKQQLLAALL
ncbi:MAG: ABC transporter ATP-binding protein [Chloroflexia bacterium]|nr:ABC transporter ATP-binding protein [Chloroflexia bacterium]